MRRLNEHSFQEFLKVKNIPLTDISGIELVIEPCLCGCGNKVKTSKDSTEKYFSMFCPRKRNVTRPNSAWQRTMKDGDFQKDSIEPVERLTARLFAQGLTLEEIGTRLEVKPLTARNYLNKFKRKVGVLSDSAIALHLGAA